MFMPIYDYIQRLNTVLRINNSLILLPQSPNRQSKSNNKKQTQNGKQRPI